MRNSMLLLAALTLGWGSASAQNEEDHEYSVHGLNIGMSAQQVLEILGRQGDSAKDEKDELIIYWKLENGDVLQVNFWKDHVSHLGIKYNAPRNVAELGLVAQVDQRSALDSRDLRARYDYKDTETRDRSRIVWSRRQDSGEGYDLELQFLSGARQQYGDQRGMYVEFKYVAIPKNQRKKFEKKIREAAAG